MELTEDEIIKNIEKILDFVKETHYYHTSMNLRVCVSCGYRDQK